MVLINIEEMLTSKEQEKLRNRFNPDGSLLRQHQLRMLEMLKYIDGVCRKHDIKYWLCSGTLIGAVRHGGFIPWDDDVDIEMLREDYKKFVKVMATELQTDYVLQTHETDKGYFAPYGKLRDLHSCIKEENSNDLHYKYQGCYIDVFIMEPSSSRFLSRVGGGIWYRLLAVPNSKLHGKLRGIYYPVAYLLVYGIIFPVLRFMSFWRHRKQYRLTFGSCFYKPRDLRDIFPLQTLSFENYAFPVPGNYDDYLKKIYGDYMQLPDLEKIKSHTVKVEIYER